MTLHTPTKHSSIVGGSSAARVMNCPASVRLVQKMPEQPESPYAAEGTALHNAVEHILYEGIDTNYAEEHLLGKEFYGFALDQDQVDAVVIALRMFDDLWAELEREDGEVLTYAVETQCAFPGITDVFGTADILMVTPKRSLVLDWKFGAGVVVSAAHNSQQAFYARAAAHSAPKFFWPDGMDETSPGAEDRVVEFVVAQPRISSTPSRWKTDFAYLLDFADRLVASVGTIDHETPAFKRGEHCRWCTAQPICPSYERAAAGLAALVKAKEDPVAKYEASQQGPAPVVITPDLLADWLATADVVEAWAKSVRGIAMDMATNHGVLPTGMKLIRKLSNLTYVHKDDFDKVDKILKGKGLKASERRRVTNISPTQANALLKKKKKPLLKRIHADRFPTSLSLVSLDHKGEAVAPLENTQNKVAEGLAKLAGEAAE